MTNAYLHANARAAARRARRVASRVGGKGEAYRVHATGSVSASVLAPVARLVNKEFTVSKLSSRVFVQQDGVVIHEHAGAKGLHGPWVSHREDLHKETPKNLGDLTAEQKAQYEQALKGKNFSFMWVEGTARRRAAVESAGGTWGYGKKDAEAEAEAAEAQAQALAEAQALAADAFENRLPEMVAAGVVEPAKPAKARK